MMWIDLGKVDCKYLCLKKAWPTSLEKLAPKDYLRDKLRIREISHEKVGICISNRDSFVHSIYNRHRPDPHNSLPTTPNPKLESFARDASSGSLMPCGSYGTNSVSAN